jgi:hypothetical protein
MALAGAGAAGSALLGCASAPARHGVQTKRLAPVRVSPDRVIRTVAQLGEKLLVHNYGHGGVCITLCWGTSMLAAHLGLAGHRGPVAVLGAGAVGLTTARLAPGTRVSGDHVRRTTATRYHVQHRWRAMESVRSLQRRRGDTCRHAGNGDAARFGKTGRTHVPGTGGASFSSGVYWSSSASVRPGAVTRQVLEPMLLAFSTRSSEVVLLRLQLFDIDWPACGGHCDHRWYRRSMDMGRTAINVFGNTVAVLLVRRFSDEPAGAPSLTANMEPARDD